MDFRIYRDQFVLFDYTIPDKSEFKTWIKSEIQNVIDKEPMYKNWRFRFCGGEERNEKDFQHEIFYSILSNRIISFSLFDPI